MASNIRSRMRGRNINNISLLLDEDPHPIDSSAELIDSNASDAGSSSPLSSSPSNHLATTMAFASLESSSNAIRSMSHSPHSRIIKRPGDSEDGSALADSDAELFDDLKFSQHGDVPCSCSFVNPIDMSDFECSLCFRLFYQPITTICGHTYCKNCLISSLQYSKNCPLCRAKLFDHPSQFNHSINIVLANLIEKTFSIEYKQREIEEKARPLKLAPIPTQKPALNQSETEADQQQRRSRSTSWWNCVLLYPCDM